MHLRFVSDIHAIPRPEWDALAGDVPCLSHAYLAALQDSASVGPGSGWHSHHAILERDGRLLAAMPLYEKEHSYGEYVFDWAWADAYARSGLAYYPKWVAALPFTPIPGRRILGVDADARRALLRELVRAASASGRSSLHALFLEPEEADWARDAGLLIRRGVQFHWENRGYPDFDAFLADMNHEKRKKIRQDRRRFLAASELSFTWLDGASARDEDWELFYRCYLATYRAHRSHPYLAKSFFTGLAMNHPDAVRLLRISGANGPFAAAFFLSSATTFYGRYWGSLEHLPGLHFEACYYRAIDYAIEHGYARFEGGAQGEHKLSRGLLPVQTYSAHWIADPGFREGISRWLEREGTGIDGYLGKLETRIPFRSDRPDALPERLNSPGR